MYRTATSNRDLIRIGLWTAPVARWVTGRRTGVLETTHSASSKPFVGQTSENFGLGR
jgi:hypothetical protein